jgi:hypothetical protein
MSLQTKLAAEARLAEGQLLHVPENVEKFRMLRLRTRIPVISRRGGNIFSAVETLKSSASSWCLIWSWMCNFN